MSSVVGVAREHFGVLFARIAGSAETAVVLRVVSCGMSDAVPCPAYSAHERVALRRAMSLQTFYALSRSAVVLHVALLSPWTLTQAYLFEI